MYPLMIAPVVAGSALAVPAHRQLRHRQRTPLSGAHPVQSGPDPMAQRPQHRAAVRLIPRHLADDLVHHPHPFRRAAEHPGRGHRSRTHRRRPVSPAAVQHHHPVAASRDRGRADHPRNRCRPSLRHHPHPDQRGTAGQHHHLSLLIYRTMTRFGEPGLASAMGTVYLIVMLAVAITAIMLIWRPGSSPR